MLMRNSLHNFRRSFTLLGCRRPRSIDLRSIHVAPDCETPTPPREPASGFPAAAAAAHPRWVMLDSYGYGPKEPNKGDADAKTVAEAHDSAGRNLRVSFRLAQPPASSFLHYDVDDGVGSSAATNKGSDDYYDDNYEPDHVKIIAAHGDSVLLEKRHRARMFSAGNTTYDSFVYRASAARPVSLSLLPERSKFLMKCEEADRAYFKYPILQNMLFEGGTGLLRRSDDELLVADFGCNELRPDGRVDLYVLRHGRSCEDDQWELIGGVPIVLDSNGSSNNKLERHQWRCSNKVVPVGNRFLCWVDYIHGMLVCDMEELVASPKLRYVPLPMPPFVKGNSGLFSISDDDWIQERIQYSRNMCASAGSDVDAASVRLVSIDHRCCCGGPVHGWSTCSHSRFAFTITTWTLSLAMDDDQLSIMEWVKEGVMDSEELWALPGCQDIPCQVLPENPVVSLENPDVVCFTIREHGAGRKEWLIELDTKSKAVLSVVCTAQQSECRLPAKLMF